MESESLRKYARVFLGYRITNSWSPPEIFDNKNNKLETPPKNNQSSSKNLNYSPKSSTNSRIIDKRKVDIYSLGMILWELETE